MISQVLPAYNYLINTRKLNESTIRTFHLGYVDHKGEVYIDADFPGPMPTLDKRFYHSSLFPIFNLYGECIAVSVRPLNPSPTKYINTSYEKSEHLYGLSVTWQECLKAQSVYVVEGNISLLQMWQAGIPNCVAMLGSKLSTRQVCLLSRFVKKIILVPDADNAGTRLLQKMKENIPERLYDADVKFTYVTLSQNTDPDDFFKIKNSKEAFLSLGEQELII